VGSISSPPSMFDPMAGKSFGPLPGQYSDPTAVGERAADDSWSRPAAGGRPNLVQVEAVDRMSAILVITSQPAYLDRGPPNGSASSTMATRRCRRRPLCPLCPRTERAVELARVLRQALGISRRQRLAGGFQPPSPPAWCRARSAPPAMGGGPGWAAFGGGPGWRLRRWPGRRNPDAGRQ